MQQIILSLSNSQYSIASPYDEWFVGRIKLIDRSFRIWEKPNWKIQDSSYNSQPVVEYLRDICQTAAARLNIPFLDRTIAASPIDQIKARAAITVERFNKLIDLCDRVEFNSFQLKIEPTGLTIHTHKMLDRDDYQSLRSIADKMETTKEFYFELNDVEIVKLWQHTAIANPQLIKLKVLKSFPNNVQITWDSNTIKYICSRNIESNYSIAAIVDRTPAYAIPVSRIINLPRLIDNTNGTVKSPRKNHLSQQKFS
ncbi:hypothetical protein [Chamaesiphon sp.]|uniref:hypothetical protein n=1 Tax=Chamaesiphon sp. TaxID=2814140 RepID=UPI0035930F35